VFSVEGRTENEELRIKSEEGRIEAEGKVKVQVKAERMQ